MLAIVDLPIGTTFAIAAVLIGIEMLGPFVAERRRAGRRGTPHHIAERYGLLVIITLGEGIIGTVASINAVVHGSQGWTVDAAVVAFAGVGLTFAAWWTYFAIPWADVLALHRERAFIWGYGHIVIFGSLAAIGAGLHVAAYYLEHETEIGLTGTVAATAVPVTIYLLGLYGSTRRSRDTSTRSTCRCSPGPPACSSCRSGSRRSASASASASLVLMFAPVGDGARLRDARLPPRRRRRSGGCVRRRRRPEGEMIVRAEDALR